MILFGDSENRDQVSQVGVGPCCPHIPEGMFSHGTVHIFLILSMPHTVIIGFCLNEPSHLDLRCLTFRLSTLHINVFPSDSLLK